MNYHYCGKEPCLLGSSLTMSTENHYVKTNLEKLHQDSNLKVKELDTVCEFLVVSVKRSCYVVLSTPFEMSSGIITALPTQKDKYQNMQSLGMTLCILVSYGCVLYVCVGFLLACLCKQWWVVSQNVYFCLSVQFHKPLKSKSYGILWI